MLTSEKLNEIGQCQLDERNPEEAYDYFLEAAHMGNAQAIKNLAVLYLYGEGVSQNFEKSFRYLQIAYDLSGRVWASYEVGDCRLDIIGCDEGRRAFANYLDYLVDHKNLIAYVLKASELLAGIVYPQNIDEAIRLYEELYKRGENFGAELLGEMYYEGRYVKQDYKKALKYFSLCDVTKSFVKSFYMGMMYSKGNGVEKNLEKAVEYFESIVNANDFWKMEDAYYHKAKEMLAQMEIGEVN